MFGISLVRVLLLSAVVVLSGSGMAQTMGAVGPIKIDHGGGTVSTWTNGGNDQCWDKLEAVVLSVSTVGGKRRWVVRPRMGSQIQGLNGGNFVIEHDGVTNDLPPNIRNALDAAAAKPKGKGGIKISMCVKTINNLTTNSISAVTLRPIKRSDMVAYDVVVSETQTAELRVESPIWHEELLEFQWSQTSGPSVAIQDGDQHVASFVAPNLTQDTVLTFEVECVLADEAAAVVIPVTVTVLAVNDVPTIYYEGSMTAIAGEPMAMTIVATDPEQEALTYQWLQIAGTAVVDPTGNETDTFEFMAPNVSVPEQLFFDVSVSDGTNTVDLTIPLDVTP